MDVIAASGQPVFKGGVALSKAELRDNGRNEHFQNTFDNQKMLIKFLYHSNLIAVFLVVWRLAPQGRQIGSAAAQRPEDAPDAAGGDPSQHPGDRKRARGDPSGSNVESRKKRRADDINKVSMPKHLSYTLFQ